MDHYLAFNHEFFKKHQRKLLWLLNTPVVRLWFRWVLRLGTSSLGTHKVARIEPHAITWQSNWTYRKTDWATFKVPTFTSEFRTHWKYGKRLYYAFKPVWWLMHFWDWALADRVVPQLSFGFSTLTAYPDAGTGATTVDGMVTRGGSSQSWDSIVTGAGTSAGPSLSSADVIFAQATGTSNTWNDLRRGIFLFDTSSLPDTASISATSFSTYGNGTRFGSLSPDVNVYSSNPASNNTLVASDYSAVGTTAYATAVAWTSINDTAYTDWAFNATGISNVALTGITKLSLRSVPDAANVSPTWASGAFYDYGLYFSDQTGTTNDPKLVVTYTASTAYTSNLTLLGVG